MFSEIIFYIAWIGSWLIITSPIWYLARTLDTILITRKLDKKQIDTQPISSVRRWVVTDTNEGHRVVRI
jgi:hypothetical protein